MPIAKKRNKPLKPFVLNIVYDPETDLITLKENHEKVRRIIDGSFVCIGNYLCTKRKR